MVDIDLIGEHVVLCVVLACYLVGFVIKNYIPAIKKKYIPLIMLILGMIINLIITIQNGISITVMTFVSGGISGLASSGSYELITKSFGLENFGKVIIKKEDKESSDEK
jgi:hypothetical protein